MTPRCILDAHPDYNGRCAMCEFDFRMANTIDRVVELNRIEAQTNRDLSDSIRSAQGAIDALRIAGIAGLDNE